jgi:hypothetical protein
MRQFSGFPRAALISAHRRPSLLARPGQTAASSLADPCRTNFVTLRGQVGEITKNMVFELLPDREVLTGWMT